jgi:hypothetical protein
MANLQSQPAGYTYGTAPRSPVTKEQWSLLRQAAGFTDADQAALRMAGKFLPGMANDLFTHWQGIFGPVFVSAFVGKDGKPDEAYLAAAHARFVKWIQDTCDRDYDQAWLDYQHEIGLRHHRTKKNVTDHAKSTVPVVPLGQIIALVAPMGDIRAFLSRGGHSSKEVDAMHSAWLKSLALQVALWAHPYTLAGDW